MVVHGEDEDAPPACITYRVTRPAEGVERQQFHHYKGVTYEGRGHHRRQGRLAAVGRARVAERSHMALARAEFG